MMGLLTTQLGELKAERQILLDRLATLGLGGPLFSGVSSDDSSETEEAVDPEAEELEKLMTSRRRPSKLADALTRKAYRDYNRVQSGASVQWVQKALDDAETLGKKQAVSQAG
jgi:mannitol-1-phosphate/altronate dehydrogenase